MPNVSVIIPSYNCAAYLPRAIESVLAQTYTELEVVVVNDGSSDQTEEVVQPYLSRIRYISQQNKGLPGARNAGIRASTGEFIALLDADDSWLPHKLEVQLPRFADPAVGIVYSDLAVEYADGRTLASYLSQRPLASEGRIFENYLRSRFLFPSTMVLRRSLFDLCGLFDEQMLACEDIELFARMCLRTEVALVPEPLIIRTEGGHNLTASRDRIIRYTALAIQKILAQEPDLSARQRRVLHQQLALQYWWGGYASFKAGRLQEARRELLQALRYDPWHMGRVPRVLLATLLPQRLLGSATATKPSGP